MRVIYIDETRDLDCLGVDQAVVEQEEPPGLIRPVADPLHQLPFFEQSPVVARKVLLNV